MTPRIGIRRLTGERRPGRLASSLAETLAARFELSRGGPAHLAPMEGLRGFAVFLVFLVHYSTAVAPWVSQSVDAERTLALVHAVGNAGVDLFFVLSGYLIYSSLMTSPIRLGSYARRRLRRIYPTFLVVLAIYLALSAARPAQSKLPSGIGDALLYVVQNVLLLPGIFPIDPIITVAWSLSYEMFFYLVLPLAVMLLRLKAWTPSARAVFFVVCASTALPLVAAIGGPVRLVMFLGGILIREITCSRPGVAPRSDLALAALVMSLALPALPWTGAAAFILKLAGLLVGLSLLCLTCIGRPGSTAASLFRWTPIRWLGNMSYSYYLLHGLTLNAMFLVLGSRVAPLQPPGWALLMLAPAFLATLLPTALLFLWVERPLSLVPREDRTHRKARAHRSAPAIEAGNGST